MLISEEGATDLKVWIIKKLEDISDADSDVLADYVLALIRSDVPESQLRRSLVENLEDFVKFNTTSFVDELLQRVSTKAISALNRNTNQIIPPHGSKSLRAAVAVAPGRDGRGTHHDVRKRPSLNAKESLLSQGNHSIRNDRSARRLKKIVGSGKDFATRVMDGRVNKPPPSGPKSFRDHRNQSNPPLSSHAPTDHQQATAALWALHSMGFPLPPLTPEELRMFEQGMIDSTPVVKKHKDDIRCKDYEIKGICHRGVNCPYLHDANQIIMPAMYEDVANLPQPNGPRIHDPAGKADGRRGQNDLTRERGSSSHRTRGRGSSDRAAFSQSRPRYESYATTIVVERIPSEFYREDAIQDFFARFGTIKEVGLQPENQLALVHFDTHASAQAAYKSPKAVFENRFVKVYWYNPNAHQLNTSETQSPLRTSSEQDIGHDFDKAAFERNIEEAQKRLEERRTRKAETDVELARLANQRAELEKRRREEQQKLEQKLKEIGATMSDPYPKSTTDALRQQLKALQDEAESLGLQPEPWTSTNPRPDNSLKGYSSWRGSPRYSRGGSGGRALPRGGIYNLDNRPKTVKVEGVTFDKEKDELLRQYLFSVGDFVAIETSESTESQIVTFKDRTTAERFFYGTREIPGVGKLEFTWQKSALAAPEQHLSDNDGAMDDIERHDILNQARSDAQGEHDLEQKEFDYDVAEDQHNWVR